jgi:tRNA pseudouridine38-40 synthase
MARYQVILAYDGTRFLGFQRQSEARTVQAEIEKALRQLKWDGGSVLAAGRTDTGVHACGQVISFDLDWHHPTDELLRALNAYLPEDVAAREVIQAAGDFHPRYNATSRKYLYRIYCQPTRHPLLDRYAWRVWPAAEFEPLRSAASYLPGTHDFAAFGTPPRSGGSTIRTIYQAFWSLHEPYLEFVVTADAFLYHMVRRLVSLQVEIGQGRLPPESVLKYVLRQETTPLQGLAPPQGLSLVEVSYKQRNKSNDRKAEMEKYDLHEEGNK